MSERIYIDPVVAQRLNTACRAFSESVMQAADETTVLSRARGGSDFRSALEINGVYSSCAGIALPKLMDDFGSQSTAMAALFQIAGGNLSTQDEEAAAALKNAASAPPSINGPSMAIAGLSSISAFDAESSRTDKFSWVGGEDASGMSLDEMKSGAESLSPGDLRSTAEQFSTASQTLSSAADQLLASVNSELGSSWQGEFANTAIANVAQFHSSATELAGQLTTVADRANSLAEGYKFTRDRVGGITPDTGAVRDSEAAASLESARLDAQRVIHSEYNPRLEGANLSGLTFTPAHRVGSVGGVGTEGVPPVALWNHEIVGPEGVVGGASRTGVDAVTQAASSSAGGAGAPAPSGGGGSPSSAGSPVVGTSAASGNAASGDMPAGVGAATGGATHPVSAPATSPSRSGAAATAPAASGTSTTAGRDSSPPPGARTVSGTSSPAPIGARGMASGSSSTGAGSTGAGSAGSGASAGARPLSAAAGGSARSGLPFSTGGNASSGAGTSGGPGAASGAPRAGTGPIAGTGLTAGSGSPGTSPGSAGSAAGSRVGGPMMGAMPMGAGGRSGDKSHSPPDYLVHPSHSSELIGNLPAAVQPVLRGNRSSAE